jgi:hypothetical protein
MNARELLCRMIERQLDSLFRAARSLPPGRLDLTPAGGRSALDQLQEVATAPDWFKDAHKNRKIVWSDEMFGAWKEARGKLTSLDEIETHARASHGLLFMDILSMSDSDLEASVEMPFPGEWKVADILAYYHYNAAYHEGQITQISHLLATEST